jgi:hypothetical protein
MAVVEIQRASGGYTEHLYPFEIVIDGEVVGHLGRGESEAVDVLPGSHEIFVRLFWSRSERVELHLEEAERVSFRCDTRAKFFTDFYWATFKRDRYLRLTQVARQGDTRVDRDHQPKVASTFSPPADRPGRPSVMGVVLVGIILAVLISLALALTGGHELLASASVIYIAARVVIAITFHFLASGSAPEFVAPFKFRIQEAIISAVFALAGFATLAGALEASDVGGWLALVASAVAAGNVLVTR